jgi:hypothetical protein
MTSSSGNKAVCGALMTDQTSRFNDHNNIQNIIFVPEQNGEHRIAQEDIPDLANKPLEVSADFEIAFRGQTVFARVSCEHARLWHYLEPDVRIEFSNEKFYLCWGERKFVMEIVEIEGTEPPSSCPVPPAA